MSEYKEFILEQIEKPKDNMYVFKAEGSTEVFKYFGKNPFVHSGELSPGMTLKVAVSKQDMYGAWVIDRKGDSGADIWISDGEPEVLIPINRCNICNEIKYNCVCATAIITKSPHSKALEISLENIKEHIVKPMTNKPTDNEVMMFLQLCLYQGLNPFIKDAYLLKYKDSPAHMVVSKGAFLKKAEVHPEYQGFKAGILIITDDELEKREGTLRFPKEKLVGGWCEVYREGKQNFYVSVNFEEFNTNKSSWKARPETMIRKVAIVQALREAFPSAFHGMYTKEEMS